MAEIQQVLVKFYSPTGFCLIIDTARGFTEYPRRAEWWAPYAEFEVFLYMFVSLSLYALQELQKSFPIINKF